MGRPAGDDRRLVEGFPATARDAALITPGKAGSGRFPRAQPITRIDGDRPMDLPTEDRIGIRTRPVDLFEIGDPSFDDPIPPGLEGPGMISMEMDADSEPLTPLTMRITVSA